MFRPFLLSLMAINFGISGTEGLRTCWTCVGKRCEDSAQWVEETCHENQRYCYSFEDERGTVTKRGCAGVESCISIPGWKFGTDCELCESDNCNGQPEQLVAHNGDRREIKQPYESFIHWWGGVFRRASSLRCWSCEGTSCGTRSLWKEKTCHSKEQYCFTFYRESGPAIKKGWARGPSFLSIDGWEFGIDIDVCESKLCNDGGPVW